MKALLIAVLAVGVLAMSTPETSIAALAVPCEGIEGLGGGWSLIDIPSVAASRIRYLDYVANPANPKQLFVTRGDKLYRSDNAGCSFNEVFALPGSLPSEPGSVCNRNATTDESQFLIERVATGTTHSTRDRVYILVRPGDYDGTRVQGLSPAPAANAALANALCLFGSDDAGNTWRLLLEKIDRTTTAQLLVAPNSPDTLMLLGNALWVSNDAGQTWTERTAPPNLVNTPCTNFEINPANPRELWALIRNSDPQSGEVRSYARSRDQGETWEPYSVPWSSGNSPIFDIELLPRSDGQVDPLLIGRLAPNPNEFTGKYGLFISRDDGGSWQELDLPYPGQPPTSWNPWTCAESTSSGAYVLVTKVYGEDSAVYRYNVKAGRSSFPVWVRGGILSGAKENELGHLSYVTGTGWYMTVNWQSEDDAHLARFNFRR